MKRILLILLKAVAALLLVLALVVVIFSVSPVYHFEAPHAFDGPDIYNPYDGVTCEWKRANFHTHTRVDNILNECPDYPDKVYDDYRKLGYDIVSFSNHNLITPHPVDTSLQIDVYEHGINIAKFHKLVFNPRRVHIYDHLIPLMVSQKQWQYDYLGSDSDFLVMNHPDRTLFMNEATMRKLSGYRFIEADCGVDQSLVRWDEGLSAGHYSHNLISDDCHDSGNHRKIARRCIWLDVPSARYEDVAPALIAGRFYAMRIPDFGDGDWAVKYAANANLPCIEDIGVRSDSVYVQFSAPARIEAWGQGHELLAEAEGNSLVYRLLPNEPYVRFIAFFNDGVTIYSNAFARYDQALADSPYEVAPHKVNWLLTVLYNLGLLILALVLLRLLKATLAHKKKKTRPTVEELRFRGIVP